MDSGRSENLRRGDGGTEVPPAVSGTVGEIRNYAVDSPFTAGFVLGRSNRSIHVNLESKALRLLDKVCGQDIEIPHDRPDFRVFLPGAEHLWYVDRRVGRDQTAGDVELSGTVADEIVAERRQ